MLTFVRFTTIYDAVEDRIRITGIDDQGTSASVWINWRLLRLLFPPLLDQYGKIHGPLPAIPALTDVADPAASAALAGGAAGAEPVHPREWDASWLATAVDYTMLEAGLRLVFRNVDQSARAAIDFGHAAFGQWLEILQQLFLAAEWPIDFWFERPVAGAFARTRDARLLN